MNAKDTQERKEPKGREPLGLSGKTALNDSHVETLAGAGGEKGKNIQQQAEEHEV
ncbi:hypothetical protein [Desulfococcus sp.]|uniref:hypothetical protein n=1 Tax=Desulfococcus sp. TaxID=2025834 RepID=UPI0035934316